MTKVAARYTESAARKKFCKHGLENCKEESLHGALSISAAYCAGIAASTTAEYELSSSLEFTAVVT